MKFWYQRNRVITEIVVISVISGLGVKFLDPYFAIFATWWVVPIAIVTVALLLLLVNYSSYLRYSFEFVGEEFIIRRFPLKPKTIPLGKIRRITVRGQKSLWQQSNRQVLRISARGPMVEIRLSDLNDPEGFLSAFREKIKDRNIPLIIQDEKGKVLPENPE
jgi:hypothetical protein